MRVSAPDRMQRSIRLVDRDGIATEQFFSTIDQIWAQAAAGYTIVPCNASGKNAITLTPRMHREGGSSLANYMPFAFVAEQTSDGAVTIKVADHTFLKAYKTNGAAQAGSGDVVATSLYVAYFNQALDGGAGGYVVK